MLKFYFNASPNPTKVVLFLEEAGLPYQPVPVDTRKGEQFKPEFLAINPNGKVPAIDDGGVIVFDSNAILLYLAEAVAVVVDVRGYRRRSVLGTGGSLQALCAREGPLCPYPLPV
jgi:glutathione S-transferase